MLEIFCSVFTNRRYVDCWYHAIAIIIVLNQSINSMYIHRDLTFSTIETIFYNIKKNYCNLNQWTRTMNGVGHLNIRQDRERESLITYFDHHYGNLPKLTTDFNASRTPFGNRFVLVFWVFHFDCVFNFIYNLSSTIFGNLNLTMITVGQRSHNFHETF